MATLFKRACPVNPMDPERMNLSRSELKFMKRLFGYFGIRDVMLHPVPKLAMRYNCLGMKEDAIWIAFLFACTHDYDSTLNLYHKVDGSGDWDFGSVHKNFESFRLYFLKNYKSLNFGLHRWRQKERTLEAFRTYIKLVDDFGGGSQEIMFKRILEDAEDYYLAWDSAYSLISTSVITFGRLSTCDFLKYIDTWGIFPFRPYKDLHVDAGEKKGLELLYQRSFTLEEANQTVKVLCEKLKADPRDAKTQLCHLHLDSVGATGPKFEKRVTGLSE